MVRSCFLNTRSGAEAQALYKSYVLLYNAHYVGRRTTKMWGQISGFLSRRSSKEILEIEAATNAFRNPATLRADRLKQKLGLWAIIDLRMEAEALRREDGTLRFDRHEGYMLHYMIYFNCEDKRFIDAAREVEILAKAIKNGAIVDIAREILKEEEEERKKRREMR